MRVMVLVQVEPGILVHMAISARVLGRSNQVVDGVDAIRHSGIALDRELLAWREPFAVNQ